MARFDLTDFEWSMISPLLPDRLLEAVSKAYDGDIQMIDSSSIRVPVAWVARGPADEDSRTCRFRGPADRFEAGRRPSP